MYPIIFTFLPFYFYYLLKTKIQKLKIIIFLILFFVSFIIFNLPEFYTNKIGPTYSDLGSTTSASTTTQSNTLQTNNKTHSAAISKIEQLANKFYVFYLVPKGNGEYLFIHLDKDFNFFGTNNIFVLFGFLLSMILILNVNKTLFLLMSSLFVTSFILWGNMNVYGGGPIDLTNLRNTHTRYMLPIFTIFYVVGFYYTNRIIRNKRFLLILLMFFASYTIFSLRNSYPFNTYSLINTSGYFYDMSTEKRAIANLQIPRDSIFVSASYDDYDLPYYFNNYADFKQLSKKPNQMKILLNKFVTETNPNTVYLLFPINDSRFSPMKPNELSNLYIFMKKNFTIKTVYQDEYKKLLSLNKKL